MAVEVAAEMTEESSFARVEKLKPAKIEKSRKKLPKIFPNIEQIVEGNFN